ncbi:hypothetical protein Q6D67_14115 [Haliea sp. E1-2-M8]|uniref:hypothetical protein n=1 Tax=Haliea sp. E1-2-M8 TaxID=3064706 RepID=UPI00272223F1|nr:hypothetical protein [Haliea sp. E1-2-M8]MDO8862842.1 hypothetical protein [Haliea sp. E1-2-M8]
MYIFSGQFMRQALLVLVVLAPPALAQFDIQTRLPTCATLNWSEAVHRSYPDIDEICQGVYQKDGVLYARAEVEVLRVSGNRLTLRTLHTDGSRGHQTSMRVGPNWRARIDGREYRVGELVGGQRLSVYIPEDRFAFALDGASGVAEHDTSPEPEGGSDD